MECWKEYETRRDYSKYCCFDCKIKHQRLKDIRCAVCWKMFHPSKSKVKTCSKECWYKLLSIWEKKCKYCWKKFKPEHSYNKYCSRECSIKANSYLFNKTCPICWTIFKPKCSKTICCSQHCWQVYNWINKNDRQKEETIRRLANSNIDIISKTNLLYEQALLEKGYDVEKEFIIGKYSYDLKVNDILIEINPFAYHSSNWVPREWKIKPKHPKYHYNKAKYAIEHWYKIIEFWVDWMNDEKLFYLIDNLKQTELGKVQSHWINRKTKEHILDNWQDESYMLNNWFVKIYDAWESYKI